LDCASIGCIRFYNPAPVDAGEKEAEQMPMCDAYIPKDVLGADAERELLSRVTDLLLEHEGADPTNEIARSIAWLFVHRHEMFVAGAPADGPHYKFVCQVPEGQYNDERRAAVTAAITQAVVDAEAGRWPNPEFRVWVFSWEVPDGTWGGNGQIFRLPDIAGFISPELREVAEERLAVRRREQAAAILEAAPAELTPSSVAAV
jgi:phenylpyruvate tautomerase PptA (4-oxalocrotonate tautomerase family)